MELCLYILEEDGRGVKTTSKNRSSEMVFSLFVRCRWYFPIFRLAEMVAYFRTALLPILLLPHQEMFLFAMVCTVTDYFISGLFSCFHTANLFLIWYLSLTILARFTRQLGCKQVTHTILHCLILFD